MDGKKAIGVREEMLVVIGTTPTLIFTDYTGRDAVVMYNEGPADIRIGHSGSATGMLLPADQGFTDNYSQDSWWGVAASSSGTLSGFKVVGG